jgi:predicted nucleic acid-binding Zn ribbon protein
MSHRKTNTQKLGDAIKEMLRLNGIDEKIDEHLLIRSWEKTVGPMISKHTTEIYVSGKKLFVKVDSSPLKQEIQYSKTKLMKDLNEQVGKVVIEEIVLK